MITTMVVWSAKAVCTGPEERKERWEGGAAGYTDDFLTRHTGHGPLHIHLVLEPWGKSQIPDSRAGMVCNLTSEKYWHDLNFGSSNNLPMWT